MKAVTGLGIAIVASVICSSSSLAADNKPLDPKMCTYQACGTCTGETVMLCATGELEGCITPICSDVSFPADRLGGLKKKADLLKASQGGVKQQIKK